ncbi:MAG: hypothetical protein ACJ786_33925 [Catenulispora sp.]
MAGDSEDDTGVAQIEFAEAVLARVAGARHRLSEAAATADSYAVAAALDELELALGLARESGVEVPHPEHKHKRTES